MSEKSPSVHSPFVTPGIPLVDVKAQYASLLPEIKQAIDGVLESGQFVFGPNVGAFEEEAARYLGVRETIGVGNGTDAIVLVLNALGIGPGDEVVCPAFTFFATAEAIARVGAAPVFADIDPVTSNLDPEKVKRGYAALARMEQQLAATPFLVGGTVTLADISLLAYTRVAHEGGFHLDGYAGLRRWIGETEKFLKLPPTR